MFAFITNAINKIKQCLLLLKELSYKIVNAFGYKIQPAHFTKQDNKKYTEWVSKHQALLKEISINGELPSCFQLEQNSANAEPKTSFIRPDLKRLDSRQSKILYGVVASIFNKITVYLDGSTNKKSFVVRNLNADEKKMSVERMILYFIAENMENQLIHFDNRPEELSKINLFLKYLSALMCDPLIKADKSFHDVLRGIKDELTKAKNLVGAKVEADKLRDSISSLETRVGNFITSSLNYLSSILNFKKEILSTEDVYYCWQQEVEQLRPKEKKFSDITPQSVEKVRSQHFINQRYNLTIICPQLKQILIKESGDESSAALTLTEFQNNLLILIMTHKMLQYFSETLSSCQGMLGKDVVKKMMLYVEAIAYKISLNLKVINKWSEQYRQRKEAYDTPEQEISMLDNIIASFSNLQSQIDELIKDTKHTSKLIAEHESKFETANQEVDQQLDDYMDNVLGSNIAVKVGLQYRNKAIISDAIITFLHDLRENGRYDDRLYRILSEYFIIDDFAAIGQLEPMQKVIGIDEKKTILLDKPAYQYIHILLKIFINISKEDFEGNDELKEKILNKLQVFLINDFMINDQQAIKLLFVCLKETVREVKNLEERNKKLVASVKKYLESFENSITKVIKELDSGDIFTVNSILEKMLRSMLIAEQQDVEQITYHKITDQDRFINILEKFVNNILLKVRREALLYKTLINKLDQTELSAVNPAFIELMGNQIRAFAQINSETSELLLHMIELINNLVNAYVVLKEECAASLTQGASVGVEDADQSEPIDDTSRTKDLLVKIDDVKQDVMSIGQKALKKLKGLDAAIGAKDQLLLLEFKQYSERYLKDIDNIMAVTRSVYHYWSCITGGNFLLECAAARYICDLVLDIQSEDNVTKRLKLYLVISSLHANKQNFSTKFNSYITHLYDCLSSVVLLDDKAAPLKLTTTRWNGGDVMKVVDTLETQVSSAVTRRWGCVGSG